jgi:hypothetical protein
VQLLATVVDPNNAELTTLDPQDIRVTENGAPATVTKVESSKTVPKLQILVDNGLGIPPESISDLRTGLRGLVEALPPNLEVTLVATAPQPRFIARAVTDRQKLLGMVDLVTPDSGAGRFVESLHEATSRIERDKDGAYTIVSIGTSSGDVSVRDRDVKEVVERVRNRGTVVHVVLLKTVGRSASLGVIQGELGQVVTASTGGRFENIAVANRLATLLPEIGAQIAPTLTGSSQKFRIYVDRPSGASGDLGKLSIAVAGKNVTSVTLVN